MRWAAARPVPAAGSRATFRLAVNQRNYPWVPANTPMYDNFASYAVRGGNEESAQRRVWGISLQESTECALTALL